METERTRTTDRSGTAPQSRQQIHYTQPKPFFRRKLVLQLLTVAAVVLAIAIGVSIFFKVDTVKVAGAQKYDVQTVIDASQIEKGDSLLFFGQGKAAKRIKTALPYVGNIRFEIKLPGTVNIIIEEKTVAYTMEAEDGSRWKVTSDGYVVEKVDKSEDLAATITGILLKAPTVGGKAVALENTAEGETTTNKERLQTAMQIVAQLERWQLFSDVTKIDVTDLFALRLYYGSDYRVELGGREDMEDKIRAVKAAMIQLENSGATVLKLVFEDEIWGVHCNPWTTE